MDCLCKAFYLKKNYPSYLEYRGLTCVTLWS